MTCPRCKAIKPNGDRCKNHTCRGFYCWIHLKSKDDLRIKKSELPNAGLGLYYVGKKDVKKDKTITRYSAERVSSTPNRNSAYVLQVGNNRFLDSENPRNFAGRYINSVSGTNKRPNTRFSKGTSIYTAENRKYVPVKTTTKIKPNTELLATYGRKYKL
jgi:hypothetical protein